MSVSNTPSGARRTTTSGCRRSTARTLVLALVALGCDPGWVYEAPSGTPVQANGLRYDMPSANPKARIHASAFTSSLNVEVTLTNVDLEPLDLVLPTLRVTDGRGVSLREHFPIRRTCPLSDRVMTVASGGSCTLTGDFAIQPLVPGLILSRNNPDLARISVKVLLRGATARRRSLCVLARMGSRRVHSARRGGHRR